MRTLKKGILGLLVLSGLLACNKPLEVSQLKSETGTGNDFNVLILPITEEITKTGDTFLVPFHVYLRPFDSIGGVEYKMLFESSTYGQLGIDNRQLLPGDQIRIAYGRFTNNRLRATFGVQNSGTNTVTLTFSNGSVKKVAKTEINITP